MKKLGSIALIILLIGTAIWIKGKFFPTEIVKTKTVTKTQVDTVYQDSIVYRDLPAPEPDTVIVVDKDTIKMPPDTTIFEKYADLFQKYHSQYIYEDTVKDDSSAFIAVHDIITKNKITRRELYYQNRTPTSIYKETTIYNQRKWFVGAQFGMQTIQPTIAYKDLNDIIYSVGYNITGPEKGVRFGIRTSISSVFSN